MRPKMFNILFSLADKLDNNNCKKEADFIDELIKNAEIPDTWEEETKVDVEPMPLSAPPLDEQALKTQKAMNGMEIVSQLRHIFASAPDPDHWPHHMKISVMKLIDRLQETLV
jgi:hypothetical protein